MQLQALIRTRVHLHAYAGEQQRRLGHQDLPRRASTGNQQQHPTTQIATPLHGGAQGVQGAGRRSWAPPTAIPSSTAAAAARLRAVPDPPLPHQAHGHIRVPPPAGPGPGCRVHAA